MPQLDAQFSLTQLQVALHQLDRAALLFLDSADFISAITLAGAADSIMGETLHARGVDATLDREKQFLKAGEAAHLTSKQINDEHLNLARNYMKHKVVPDGDVRAFALETEAIYILVRTYANAVLLGVAPSAPWTRFVQWVKQHRPDLVET